MIAIQEPSPHQPRSICLVSLKNMDPMSPRKLGAEYVVTILNPMSILNMSLLLPLALTLPPISLKDTQDSAITSHLENEGPCSRSFYRRWVPHQGLIGRLLDLRVLQQRP